MSRKALLKLGVHMSVFAQNLRKADAVLGSKEFAYVFSRLFSKGLQDGWFTPHPYEVVLGSLNGVGEGLSTLMNGKASAVKYVYRIADTK